MIAHKIPSFNSSSFHFAQAVFSKARNKFHLGPVWRNPAYAKVGLRLRQYINMPLVKPVHMPNEVRRLEGELRALCKEVPQDMGRNLNAFHRYFVEHWMLRVGPQDVSVYGAPHKTNNVIERLVPTSICNIFLTA